MAKKEELIMGLTRDELIDIKNSFIFAQWFQGALNLDPRFMVHSKTESEVAIVHINNDITVALEEGGTRGPADEIKRFVDGIKKGMVVEMKHLKDCNCIEDRPVTFMISIMDGYKNFIEDDEGKYISHKERLAMDNNDKELKKYARKYVRLCERLGKGIGIPGGNKKYWKIIQSKN